MAVQPVAAGMQPPFDGSEGEHQEFGDAGGGPLLIVKQLQHDLKLRGQIGQQRADRLPPFQAQQLLQRPRRAPVGARHQQAFQAGRLRGLAAAMLKRHAPRAIARDRTQPAREFGRILESGQRPKGQQKSLLRHILRRFRRTQHLLSNDLDRAAEAAHQLVAGFRTAQLRDFHQFAVADKLEAALHRHIPVSSCL